MYESYVLGHLNDQIDMFLINYNMRLPNLVFFFLTPGYNLHSTQ